MEKEVREMPILQFKNKQKNVGKMEIKNQTDTTAELEILGDIVSDKWGKWSDDDTCPSDIREFLKNLDGAEKIHVHINSGGGSVFAGIAIHNMLKQSSAEVTVHIDGIAASIASVIACAGDRVILPENGTFMIHKPTNGYFLESLNADQLRKDADTLDHCQNVILQTYMSKAKDGITEEQVNEMINEETWMNGKEASEYFDFEVEDSVKAAACTSDFFQVYQHTPEAIRKDSQKDPDNIDAIADAVLKRIQEREDALKHAENEKTKHELLGDLDLYGI